MDGHDKKVHMEVTKSKKKKKKKKVKEVTDKIFRLFIDFSTKFEMRIGSFECLPFFFLLFLLSGHLLHVHLIALLTGNGQSDNQRNKLLKVHLAVTVGVQVLHDFVHGCGVLLGLS